MNAKARVMILIPTRNQVDEIDSTLNSIKAQDYDLKNVYVVCMDFGSTDGTYEKLIGYAGERFGVYQNRSTTNRRLMLSMMARTLRYIHPGGYYSYVMVLYPGDEMYPNCIRRMTDTMIQNQPIRPASVICEADIKLEDGKTAHQKPLFEDNRIIDGNSEMVVYVSRGYDHQIHMLRYGFGAGRYRANGEMNEGRWWNKCARAHLEQKVYYIKEPLILEKQVEYEDELEEILLRWESLIVQIRRYEAKFGTVFVDSFLEKGASNLAYYALWRSCHLMRKGLWREAGDCLLISQVIVPAIADDTAYLLVKRAYEKQEIDAELGELFSQKIQGFLE